MWIATAKSPAAGRSVSPPDGTRASQRPRPDPVDPAEVLRDATSREFRELQQLERKDRQAGEHEQAHQAAGGREVRGGASYGFLRGPDRNQHAVAGEVQIDMAMVRDDPQAMIGKMQAVQRAVPAPTDPPTQHRAIAAQAAPATTVARRELAEQGRSGDGDTAAGDQLPERRARVAGDAYRVAAQTLAREPRAPLLDLFA